MNFGCLKALEPCSGSRTHFLELRVQELDFLKNSRPLVALVTAVLELCDHAEGSHNRGGGAPVCIVVVLATFQEVLVSVVVGLLIEDPRTIHHHTGVELAEIEGFVNRWAILNALCRLAAEVLFVIESDLPGLSINLERVRELKLMKLCLCFVSESLDLFFFPNLL